MIIQQALEVKRGGKGTGLYHMTERSDESDRPAWPVGYCAADCPGHAGAAEAEDHYRHWQADHARFDVDDPGVRMQCAICNEWTTLRAYPAGSMSREVVVCRDHQRAAYLYEAMKR